MKKLRSLDLFAGAAGFTLGLHHIARPVAYCDISPGSQALLSRRMEDGRLPKAPIFPDVRDITAKQLGRLDLITAGFPCQDVSSTGLRAGLKGQRSGLVKEVLRLVEESRPRFALFENVPPIARDGGLLNIVRQLNNMGYDVAYMFHDAASLGAVHRRQRWFMLARQRRGGAASLREDAHLARKASRSCAALASHLRRRTPVLCDVTTSRCDRRPGEGTLWGNSVVPAVVCRAFSVLLGRLVSDTNEGEPSEPRLLPSSPTGYMLKNGEAFVFPKDWELFNDVGCSTANARFHISPTRLVNSNRATRQVLPTAKPEFLSCLPTPRTGAYSGSPTTSLSTRTRRDLAPVLFASDLVSAKTRRHPRYAKHFRVNADFLAGMMGFPKNWAS